MSLAAQPIEYMEGTQNVKVNAATFISEIGDVVLSRRDMAASYHLSVVCDDADQNITDVIRGEDLAPATVETAAPAPKPAAAPVRKASGLAKPFIQIGIFSVKSNADNTATSLRGIGILPSVIKGDSQGKDFWRVIVGPAGSSSERATLLKKVKQLGFNDAYFVTN